MKNEIVIFENQNVKLEVNMQDETVWLSQKQMSNLFGRDQAVISRHIKNIFEERELVEKRNMQKMHIANSDKPVTFYSLDVIISVGYRVKSKNGVIFRQWANGVLKDYLLKGYAVNNQRLEALEKAVKLINIANRADERMDGSDAKEILRIIDGYTRALGLLDDYDHKALVRPEGNKDNRKVSYEDCINIINTLRFDEESEVFAVERNKGLEAIIGNIYQSFDGKDVYGSVEEKAANFLYMIVKDHVFADGNKRIAATLFIYFLSFYGILYVDGRQTIDNNTLTAVTLLIAESNPKEKSVIVDLVMNFLV